jgi:hypothetical protein
MLVLFLYLFFLYLFFLYFFFLGFLFCTSISRCPHKPTHRLPLYTPLNETVEQRGNEPARSSTSRTRSIRRLGAAIIAVKPLFSTGRCPGSIASQSHYLLSSGGSAIRTGCHSLSEFGSPAAGSNCSDIPQATHCRCMPAEDSHTIVLSVSPHAGQVTPAMNRRWSLTGSSAAVRSRVPW